jgi:hypothetical protein
MILIGVEYLLPVLLPVTVITAIFFPSMGCRGVLMMDATKKLLIFPGMFTSHILVRVRCALDTTAGSFFLTG